MVNRKLSAAIAVMIAMVITLNTPAQPSSWVEKSNGHTQLLLEMLAKYAPESAARFGIDGIDENIMDLSEGYEERQGDGEQNIGRHKCIL